VPRNVLLLTIEVKEKIEADCRSSFMKSYYVVSLGNLIDYRAS
jgi:hypothetical protein